jgi:hypothetical protein
LGIFFIQKIFSSGPIELIKGEKSNPQQKESNNLETYEEDFKAIDEALNNIDFIKEKNIKANLEFNYRMIEGKIEKIECNPEGKPMKLEIRTREGIISLNMTGFPFKINKEIVGKDCSYSVGEFNGHEEVNFGVGEAVYNFSRQKPGYLYIKMPPSDRKL